MLQDLANLYQFALLPLYGEGQATVVIQVREIASHQNLMFEEREL